MGKRGRKKKGMYRRGSNATLSQSTSKETLVTTENSKSSQDEGNVAQPLKLDGVAKRDISTQNSEATEATTTTIGSRSFSTPTTFSPRAAAQKKSEAESTVSKSAGAEKDTTDNSTKEVKEVVDEVVTNVPEKDITSTKIDTKEVDSPTNKKQVQGSVEQRLPSSSPLGKKKASWTPVIVSSEKLQEANDALQARRTVFYFW